MANTRAGQRYGEKDYVHSGCGFGRAATLHLLNQGVRVVGTNGWSWDVPFSHTLKRFQATGDASLIWEGHKAGRETGYYNTEPLHSSLRCKPPAPEAVPWPAPPGRPVPLAALAVVPKPMMH